MKERKKQHPVRSRTGKPSVGRRDNNRNQHRKKIAKTKHHSGVTQPSPKRKEVFSPDKLKIYALGGLEEVGRNMTVFEYENDIVIVDMGHQFPEEEMHGIDYILPNISSLKGKEKNIRAVLITHGHLDHVGAAPHLLPELGNPLVIAAPMTAAILRKQIEDHSNKFTPKIMELRDLKSPIKLGKITINFFQVTHSIKDALGIILQTPVVTVIHPGDWRYDLDPVEGPKTDMTHLAKWKTKTRPVALMMESLGSTQQGFQGSEMEVYKNMEQIISTAPSRVIFGTFSSMIERIGQIIQISEKYGKKVAVDGYSMKSNVEIGRKFGFIKTNKETLIDIANIDDYPKNKVVVICTGSQGEDRAVLRRIANGDHRFIKIEPNDTIVFSSSVIPGNERTIQTLKDRLYRLGANVIHKEIMDVHAGGHGKIEDIKLLLKEVQPDYLIPVYANHYLLQEASKVAQSVGFPKEKIFVADNGQIIEFDKKGGRLTNQRVVTDYVFVDGLGVGDVSSVVLKDRQVMASDGMIVVIVTIDKKRGVLVQNPDLISRGFIYMKENKKLIEDTRMLARKIFKGTLKGGVDEGYYKDKIRTEVSNFLYQKTQRRPMVLPVIIQI
ncbi:MAG: ribonuclease J [Candidatus Buchananbacteria bacterium]|nr:ribonuclease J [Candidatus Buchananbacteria bacterium]